MEGRSGGGLGTKLKSMLMTLKGLPMTYNRDLQEDKQQLMEAADTVISALEAGTGMVEEMQVDVARASEAASDPALVATDIADRLVQEQGMPFREAYARVKESIFGGTADEAESVPEVSAWDSVQLRDAYGGTSPGQVSAAVMRGYGELDAARLRGEW